MQFSLDGRFLLNVNGDTGFFSASDASDVTAGALILVSLLHISILSFLSCFVCFCFVLSVRGNWGGESQGIDGQ